MIQRILYGVLGAIITAATLGFLMLREANHTSDPQREVPQKDSKSLSSDQNQPITRDSLIGTWSGKESWGTTRIITRNADGSFLEDTDFNHADVLHDPAIVHSEGYWALAGQYYSYYYTKSSDPSFISRPPIIVKIAMKNDTEIGYSMDEGNPYTEKRKNN